MVEKKMDNECSITLWQKACALGIHLPISQREIYQWLIVPFVVSDSVRWVATVDLKLP